MSLISMFKKTEHSTQNYSFFNALFLVYSDIINKKQG